MIRQLPTVYLENNGFYGVDALAEGNEFLLYIIRRFYCAAHFGRCHISQILLIKQK